MSSPPSNAPAPPGQLSPALRGLLETFIPAGSRCLNVGQPHGAAVDPWLLDRGCSHLDLAASQATALPLEDESFDIALLIGVLDQLRQPERTATELRRVLRPGGVLLVTATNSSYWRQRLDRAARAQDPQPGGISPAALRRLLLRGGFNLVGVEGQDGAFIRDLPFTGCLWRRQGSRPYRVAERFFPSLLGSSVGAFAIRV